MGAPSESYNSENTHNASEKIHNKTQKHTHTQNESQGRGDLLKDTQGFLESHLREVSRMDVNALHHLKSHYLCIL